MRKMILSFMAAALVFSVNTKAAGSVEETKNTTPISLPLPIAASIVPVSLTMAPAEPLLKPVPIAVTSQPKSQPVAAAPQPKPQPIAAAPQPKPKQEEDPTYSISAYSAGYESTQKHKGDSGYGITADGHHVVEGVTIACPKSIPFGTKILIDGLNHIYTCQDRGQAITEGHIDIYMDSVKRALEFGRKPMKIKVLKGEEM